MFPKHNRCVYQINYVLPSAIDFAWGKTVFWANGISQLIHWNYWLYHNTIKETAFDYFVSLPSASSNIFVQKRTKCLVKHQKTTTWSYSDFWIEHFALAWNIACFETSHLA